MRYAVVTFPVLLLAGRVLAADAAQPYKATTGPSPVATLEADWTDAARRVTVPVKLYYPKNLADLPAPAPLIIFSHGLGGSRDGYQPWAEHWASHGYIVLLPTHVGSDTSIVAGGLQSLVAAMSVQNAVRRADDVTFVIDQMQKATDGKLTEKALAIFKDRVDMKHVGMAGHSFGAQTTLMVSGQTMPLQRSFTDKRITAAIAMSPQGATTPNQKAAFGNIKIPILHITGTNDDAPPGLGNVKAIDRRIPYDNSTYNDTYLVIFAGATHMSFAPTANGQTIGQRVRQLESGSANTPEQEAVIHTLVKESSTAFWDAYLKSDAKAKAWLETDFSKVMGAAGKFESKASKP